MRMVFVAEEINQKSIYTHTATGALTAGIVLLFVTTRSHPPEGKGRISKNPNTLRKNLTVEESPTLPMTPPIVIQLVFRKWLQMAARLNQFCLSSQVAILLYS
jgi:hypothetical protein